MLKEALHIVIPELALFSSGIEEFRYVIKRQAEFLFSAVLYGEAIQDRSENYALFVASLTIRVAAWLTSSLV